MIGPRSILTRLVRPFACGPWGRSIAVAAGLFAASIPASADVPEIVTSRDRFQIPFDFDAARLAAMGANTVELYVSHNDGPWQTVSTATPDKRSFVHEVQVEGKYSFCVRARKQDGSRVPDGPLASSLNVIVDKTPPSMMVRTKATAEGTVTIAWSIEDDRLDNDSLELEIRDSAGRWKPLAVRSAAEGIEEIPSMAGEEVRLSCRDTAGLQTVVTRELPEYEPVAQAQLASANQPAELPAPVISANATANAPADLAAPPISDPVEVVDVTVEEPRVVENWDGPTIRPKGASTGFGTPPLGDVPTRTASFPGRSHFPGGSQAAIGHRVTNANSEIPRDAAWAMSITKRVQTRTFRLGYELEDVGPSGLGTVGLYITEDYGRTWFHYGNDPDAISPMDVTVPRDGVFGFSFRVRSGNGFGDLPPQPGERPEVAIAVDQTVPTIQMLPIEHRQAPNTHQIAVRWKAHDATLPPRPIRVEYGPSPSGPWTAVSPPLPNLGEYIWDVTQPMPGAVYLRVLVTDAAGNTATDFTREPLMLDFSRPAARITGVEAIVQ